MQPQFHLASRVLLAFDDFSQAGKNVLNHVQVQNQIRRVRSSAEQSTLLKEFSKFVTVFDFFVDESDSAASTSCVLIDNQKLAEADYRAFCGVLCDAFVASQVHRLVIVGALHLPDAKKDSQVYTTQLNAEESAAGSDLALCGLHSFDWNWRISHSFLVCLLQFLQIQQTPSTQLLVCKGYRPNATMETTKDAIRTLGVALQQATNEELSVDVQEATRELRFVDQQKNEFTAEGANDSYVLLYT